MSMSNVSNWRNRHGMICGVTDEFGYNTVENPVRVHDNGAYDPVASGNRPRATELQVPRALIPTDVLSEVLQEHQV